MRCQENDTGLTARLLQLFGCCDTVKDRHGYIGHDNLGLQSHGGIKEGLAVCELADDLELGLQKALSQVCETWMIVSQKDSNLGHNWTALRTLFFKLSTTKRQRTIRPDCEVREVRLLDRGGFAYWQR